MTRMAESLHSAPGRRARAPRPGAAARSGPSDEVLAVLALAFLLAVTGAWWLTALWPTAGAAPAWLQAARAVCFGAHDDGLPSAGGWILLVGEPLGMAAALYVVWGGPLVAGLRGLAASRVGKGVLALAALAVVAGAGGAGWRVLGAARAQPGLESGLPRGGTSLARLDEPAPPLRLLDQHGDVLTLARFAGRPLLVTFAFGQCETVCPLLVHDALRAQRHLAGAAPTLVVVTLDPWRDLPSRLPHLAESWGLGRDAFVAGGDVAAVERVLRDWGVAASRDPRTGDVAHPPVTYVVDASGRLAFRTAGRYDELVEALSRL